jgi:outer membrane cobalamin receptor
MKTKILLLLLAFPTTVFAQAASSTVDELSLEDLLNVKITVASGEKSKALTTREAPAIVSVITGEEIRKSGARDMVDVFRMIPGFSVQSGSDNSFTLTPASRGFKVGEGKMLLTINGFSFVDLSYVNVQVFNRFPVDQIKQIEIIRGPGSAIYGGHAELTVVNISLKDGKDLEGSQAQVLYTQMQRSYGRRNFSFAHGRSEGGYNYSINSYFGNAELSDKQYTDAQPMTYRFNDKTGYDTKFINLNSVNKNLTTRVLYADYKVQNTDNYWVNGDPYTIRFTNLQASVGYDYKLLDERLIITPYFDFNRNGAWNVTEEWNRVPNGNWNMDNFDQAHLKMTATWLATEFFDLVAGVENEHNDTTMHNSYSIGNKNYNSSLGLFAQGTMKMGNLNVTAGGRYEKNTAAKKAAFVPRFALTSLMGDFHFKVLYSEAYRTPSGTQYILAGKSGLNPETAKDKEIEVGYKLSSKSFITANVFDTTLHGPLRYNNAVSGYANTTDSGSRGAEIEYKFVDTWGNVTATGSEYFATERGYENENSNIDNHALLAIPRIKYTLASQMNISRRTSLSLQFIREEKTYQVMDNTSGEQKVDPANIVNVYVTHQNAMDVAGLDVGFGIWNLLDEDIWFGNTRQINEPPALPGPTREYGLKLSYSY